jgi:phytol kinase
LSLKKKRIIMGFNENDILAALIISGIYLLIFALAAMVHILLPKQSELSRKTAHLLGGLVALSFPYIIHDYRVIAVLSILFLGFLLLSKKLGKLQAVHGVNRRSWGAYLFPVSVFLIYVLANGKPALYFVSILVLAVSDTAAALIGSRYGSIKIMVEGNLKSLEGSIAFAFVTFLCVQIPLLLMTDFDKLPIIIIAVIAAAIVTGFELISLSGTDNLFIPLGVFYIVNRLFNYSLPVYFNTLIQLVFSIIIVVLAAGFSRRFRAGGIITMALFIFSSFALCGYWWPFSSVIFLILTALSVNYFTRDNLKEKYEVASVLWIVIIPVILIFISATINDYHILFPVFIAALGSEGFLINMEQMKKKRTKPGHMNQGLEIILIITGLIILISGSVFLPLLFYSKQLNWLALLLLTSAGTAFSIITYQLGKILDPLFKFKPGKNKWMERYNLFGPAAAGCLFTYLLSFLLFRFNY